VIFGGIGMIGHYVFAGDMQVDNNPNRIIHFDTSSNSATRFASGTEYANATVDANGLVYPLNQQSLPATRIDVYDLNTLQELTTINLPARPRMPTWRGSPSNLRETSSAPGGQAASMNCAAAAL
jgi:hypothetical protein